MARANSPSPGRGQPVQLRFETELTAEEYVSREAWRNASFPACLKGLCGFDCGLMRHGTYGRKTLVPMRVARFDCRECRTTISRLPDFAAARRRGSLQEIEDDMVVLAGSPSRWAAARPGPVLRDRINRALGRTANRRKVARLFDIETGNDGMRWSRNEERIAAEARLDGIYVIRTSLDADAIGAAEAVEAYKSLSRVERAFRLMKTSRLEVRPVHVYSAGRVRAHVFLCMLALYVEWHLRRRLAPLLYGEDDPQGARALRNSPVQKALVSESAGKKAATKRTAEGFPVHGMTTLLADLATLTLNEVMLPTSLDHVFEMLAQPTPLQRRAFELLEIDPARIVASTSPG